jgi:hypothetical protein
MPKLTDNLTVLYSRFLARQGDDWCIRFAKVCRERRRALKRLNKSGVVTIADLLARFSGLSTHGKQSAIDLINLCEIRQATPVLLAALPDRSVRMMCADVLGRLNNGATQKVFLEIGRRELGSNQPDPDWLDVVVRGLRYSDSPKSADLLISIFERRDLPGPLRGNAGDKLGCHPHLRDRRTSLYRRCRDAALRGLSDDSIDVQFWSMYVIASQCNVAGSRRKIDNRFRSALPRLRELAKDKRHAPGIWWPMSAESEDAIACIENGIWPEPDAADRWQRHSGRGNSMDGPLVL